MVQKLYRWRELSVERVAFGDLPYVRGHIDTLLPQANGALHIEGWMLLPDQPLDQVEVFSNGEPFLRLPLNERSDVAQVFQWVPHAATCGFRFELPLTETQRKATTRIDLVASYRGQQRGRLGQIVRADVDMLPSPSEELMNRVAHTRNIHSFKVGGLKTFGEFLEPLRRHKYLSQIKRALDWGCGCGRVTMFFLAVEDGPEVLGCDIDPEAIAWCNQLLQAGAFAVLQPMPPAPYPAGQFDLIVSYSVFTHLTREVQQAWLAEMNRILAPGGMFLATTHGEFAYQFCSGSVKTEFPPEGIVDSFLDETLGTIAPKNYYRATYQSKGYTLREFGRHFEVLEFIERGASNFQDLVVMRKR